ncbi:LacI family DNA-binding transcriptional regulator [Streptomyces sp. R302]|nr:MULTISPECIES: LacI family DNA-binding transcriptional regulator [unclassified Streptomyces]NML55701.1 LacI family DNA-binding transcriptional regulator [Streptomyces sp. R301]NML83957.1 LacI family DNA-binding transcriptional regulator [Streptomyces sp. R302]
MAYTEKRVTKKDGTYYRGRYKDADGKYPAVRDELGEVIKFRLDREAKQAAQDAEAAVRAAVREKKAPPSPEVVVPPTFGEYVARWWARQQGELAASTLENYLGHIESHLLPQFVNVPMPDLDEDAVRDWEAQERAAGYSTGSVQTYRSILHLILEDAIEDRAHPGPNPARRKRGRGRRSGRVGGRRRGPEKAFVSALGALLVAERAAILSGRDDEFVMTVTKGFTGMRWGELTGLEPEYVRDSVIVVEHQLYQLGDGTLIRCPPKDDSYRTIDQPQFLRALLREHLARTQPEACPCHGRKYVFRSGFGVPGERITRAQVAELAGVSAGTVSRVATGGQVAATTRARVEAARAQLEAERNTESKPHWCRKAFRASIFVPAASGWYPRRGAADPARPVCVVMESWPGLVVKGRYSADRADACWAPIEARLTPHGLRHSHKTMMEDLGTPRVLMDERMGHEDGSVAAGYSHVTDSMRLTLMAGLTGLWEAALDARAAMCPTSPVAVLDGLLRDRAAQRGTKIISRNSPEREVLRSLIPMQIASDLRKLQQGELTLASYFMKSPPVQYFDDEALANVEKFIKGEVER